MPITTMIQSGIIAAGISMGATYGTIKTVLYFQGRRQDKLESNFDDKVKSMESDSKHDFEKLESEIKEAKRIQGICHDGCYSRQKSLAEPLWKYIKGDDELPRFVPMPTYKTDKTTVQNRLTAIEDRNMQQHKEIMHVLQNIQARVGG